MNVLNKGSLGRRILKRLLSLIIVVWGVVTLSFCLQVFTGTDPAEMIVRKNSLFATEEQIQAVREQLGLDAPFHERYIDYIKGVATGDLGTAITNRQPVIENIKDALPVTCTMIIMAMAWVILFTVILSAISVIRKNGIFDNVTRIVCIIGICVPSFWLALILLTAFAVNIPIFSVIADGSIKSLILPSIAMLQRLMITAALINQPQILVADEATTAIDACNRVELMKELKSLCKEGMSILFVTHDLRAASYSDQLLIMNQGKIIESGETKSIIKNPKQEYTEYLLNACRLERRELM